MKATLRSIFCQVVAQYLAINTWLQHVSRLRVIDTNLRQIARVGWGSSQRINHSPLSPGRKGQFWTSISLPKMKISLSFWTCTWQHLWLLADQKWTDSEHKRNRRQHYLNRTPHKKDANVICVPFLTLARKGFLRPLSHQLKRKGLFYGMRPFPWEFDNLLD